MYMCRGVATEGGRGSGPPPLFNFETKQGPRVSVSNVGDTAFYGCSEIFSVFYNFWITHSRFF